MAARDSKPFEKDYLRRTAAGAWERVKPFSPDETHTLDESARLIHDFAVAVAHLPPRPADLILDLGAGACWCSDWFQRLNFQTVAVDIAVDMLALGRTRLPKPDTAWLTAGDMECLPFASSTFDKAYCLSAIHHVPDIPQALAEISRVLKPDGAAFFSEPGEGHADKPLSQAAMKDFGVLEQDIVAAEFLEWCSRAGFARVEIKPLSYVNPTLGLSREQWDAWHRYAGTRRPVRALRRIWRGVLEAIGVGKHDVLFEEAFAMTLVRLVEGAMRHHPVVVAYKSEAGSAAANQHRASIVVVDGPTHARSGSSITVHVRLTNVGRAAWPAGDGRVGDVRVGVQLVDGEGRLLNRDFHRAALPGVIAPGVTCQVPIELPCPTEPGRYGFKIDLVAEGVSWFEPLGSAVVVHPVRVE